MYVPFLGPYIGASGASERVLVWRQGETPAHPGYTGGHQNGTPQKGSILKKLQKITPGKAPKIIEKYVKNNRKHTNSIHMASPPRPTRPPPGHVYGIGQFSAVFHIFFNDFWCFPWGDFVKFFQDGTFLWGSILMSPGITISIFVKTLTTSPWTPARPGQKITKDLYGKNPSNL